MAKWPYCTGLWQRTRKAQLAEEPLCRMCHHIGEYATATVVDHIVRVKDNPELAFSGDNLQSLCDHCHNSFKQAQERGKGLPGSSEGGVPLDDNHHWNKK